MRTKIVTEFPCECAQLYYVPSTPKSQARSKKSERSKGKLIDKFRNRKTYIREAENLLNSKVKSDNAEEVHANGGKITQHVFPVFKSNIQSLN